MIVRKTGHERSLIDSLSRALRPIPYWIGYKREKYWSHEVPEAAIIAELRETLMLAFCRDVNVRCEVPYSEINGSKIKATSKGRQQQADLGIFRSQKPMAVIEVKRGHSKGSIKGDFEKLASLSDKKISFGRFIVLITKDKFRSSHLLRPSLAVRGEWSTSASTVPAFQRAVRLKQLDRWRKNQSIRNLNTYLSTGLSCSRSNEDRKLHGAPTTKGVAAFPQREVTQVALFDRCRDVSQCRLPGYCGSPGGKCSTALFRRLSGPQTPTKMAARSFSPSSSANTSSKSFGSCRLRKSRLGVQGIRPRASAARKTGIWPTVRTSTPKNSRARS